jgi:C-terminal processing protease CtpA/Prc
VIQAVDGKQVANSNQLYNALERRKPGDEVTLTLYRDGGDARGQGEAGSPRGITREFHFIESRTLRVRDATQSRGPL